MKKMVFQTVAIALLISLLSPAALQSASAANLTPSKAGNYLIQFKDAKRGKSTLEKRQRKVAKSFKHNSLVSAQDLTTEDVEALKNDPNVAFIEPDFSIQSTADLVTPNLEQVKASTTLSAGVTGTGVKVAVLDTGIDTESSELKISGGVSFVPEEATFDDLNGHGTHVAGILAALQDDHGLVGVAPNVDLYAVKVLNKNGVGSYSQLIEGLEWAVDNHIDIVSMSLAGHEDSEALKNAVQDAVNQGVLLVSAAGNEGANGITYPAKYEGVLAVGAVDAHNQHPNFSSVGPELGLVAPGVGVQGLSLSGGYEERSGTSVAVPHVSGVAALVKEQNPSFTAQQLRQRLEETATSLGNPLENGKGLVNAEAALALTGNHIPSTEPSQTPDEGKPVEEGTPEPKDPAHDEDLLKKRERISSDKSKSRQLLAPGESAIASLKLQRAVNGVEITVASSGVLHHVVDQTTLPAQKAGDEIRYVWKTDENTEPGNYRIRVHYVDAGDVIDDVFAVEVQGDQDSQVEGLLSVAAVDPTVEPNNTEAQAKFIDLNYMYESALTLSPLDITDMYKVSVPFDMDVTFYFYDWMEADNYVKIYSIEDGKENRVYVSNSYYVEDRISLKANKVYYISINPDYQGCFVCAGDDNPYEFSVSVLDPDDGDNDSPATATPISLGSSKNGLISSRYDYDYYTFKAPATGTVEIKVSSDTSLQVFEANGTTELTNQSDPNTRGNDVFLQVKANQTYYILVKGTLAKYTLTLGTIEQDTYEPNDTSNTAYPINYNMTYMSKISTATDVDFYKFTARQSSNIQISLQVPKDKNYDLLIYDASLKLVASSTKGTGVSEEVILQVTAGKTYYVKIVSPTGEYGDAYYSLKVREVNVSYKYDANNRLTHILMNGAVAYVFAHDPNGNLLRSYRTGLQSYSLELVQGFPGLKYAVSLDWKVAVQPEKFNIYQNGEFIASTTSSSYQTDWLPRGVYSYSVALVYSGVETEKFNCGAITVPDASGNGMPDR